VQVQRKQYNIQTLQEQHPVYEEQKIHNVQYEQNNQHVQNVKLIQTIQNEKDVQTVHDIQHINLAISKEQYNYLKIISSLKIMNMTKTINTAIDEYIKNNQLIIEKYDELNKYL